jgi:hypothetical protein
MLFFGSHKFRKGFLHLQIFELLWPRFAGFCHLFGRFVCVDLAYAALFGERADVAGADFYQGFPAQELVERKA